MTEKDNEKEKPEAENSTEAEKRQNISDKLEELGVSPSQHKTEQKTSAINVTSVVVAVLVLAGAGYIGNEIMKNKASEKDEHSAVVQPVARTPVMPPMPMSPMPMPMAPAAIPANNDMASSDKHETSTAAQPAMDPWGRPYPAWQAPPPGYNWQPQARQQPGRNDTRLPAAQDNRMPPPHPYRGAPPAGMMQQQDEDRQQARTMPPQYPRGMMPPPYPYQHQPGMLPQYQQGAMPPRYYRRPPPYPYWGPPPAGGNGQDSVESRAGADMHTQQGHMPPPYPYWGPPPSVQQQQGTRDAEQQEDRHEHHLPFWRRDDDNNSDGKEDKSQNQPQANQPPPVHPWGPPPPYYGYGYPPPPPPRY